MKILKNLWNGIDDSVLQDALENQFYKEPDGDYYKIGGYNDLFKQAVEQLIEDVGRQNLVFETYLTTMNLFNPSDKNIFNLQDVKCFFTSPRWAPANDGQALTECNSENDNARKIVYYENFHAARVLSHSPVPQKLGDNKDPSWKIMVSKDDASPELLIHLEEQISSVYGDVKKAYK